MPPSKSSLSIFQQLAYSLPYAGITYLTVGLSVIQGIYAKNFGLALTTIATVLLISRIFDAVTDPIVGYLSDRSHARTGSRKGFIVCGSVLIIICAYFLFVPVDPRSVDESTQVSAFYFLGGFLLFYLCRTLFDIPHNAWGSELAKTGQEKSSIFAIRALSSYLGALLFFTVPLLPFFESTAITPETLQWTVLASAALILPALLFSLKTVPDVPHKLIVAKPSVKTNKGQDYRLSLSMIISNKPLLLFLIIFLLSSLGLGIFVSMEFIFIDTYLGMGQSFAAVSLITLGVGAVSLKFWLWISNRLSKRLAWGAGMGIMVLGLMACSTFQPNEVTFLSLVFVLGIFAFGSAAGNMIAPAMLSEIIDYSRLRYKVNSDASIFSLYVLCLKTSMALGSSVGFFIAGWYGFDASASVHSPDSVIGLYWVVSWLPALLLLLSIIFIYMMPITARRHGIVRRRLDNHELQFTANIETARNQTASS